MKLEGGNPVKLALNPGEVMEVLGFSLIYRKKGDIIWKRRTWEFDKIKELEGHTDLQIVYNLIGTKI